MPGTSALARGGGIVGRTSAAMTAPSADGNVPVKARNNTTPSA